MTSTIRQSLLPGRIEDDFDEDMPPGGGGPEGDEGESDSEGDSEDDEDDEEDPMLKVGLCNLKR